AARLGPAAARLALAGGRRAGGGSDVAPAEGGRAIERCEGKGATLLAERARRDGGRVARVDHALGEVRPMRRRVQANAASAHAAHVDAAIAARDADALPTLFADVVEAVHHPTGAEHGREGLL